MNSSIALRSIFMFLCLALLSAATVDSKKPEKWKVLFNGKDIKDWIPKIYPYEPGVNFGNTFRVQEGMIRISYDQYANFNDQYGHLFYKTPFSWFHLKFEYRFVGSLQKGAPEFALRNSGVMYASQDPHTILRKQNWPISVEFQLHGGLGDGKSRPTGNMCSPGTDIVYNGSVYPEHCLTSSSKTYDGDQWVKGELIVYGDSLVTHIINGDTVLRYSKPQMGGGVAEGYNPKLWQPGKLLSSGYIALQSEGQPIDFKNISILEIKH